MNSASTFATTSTTWSWTCLLGASIVATSLASLASGDGAHFSPKGLERPVTSLDQTALIVVGSERTAMVVRTGLTNAPDGAAWFLPVPTRPSNLRLVDDPFPALDRLTLPMGPVPGLGAGGMGGAGRADSIDAGVTVDSRVTLGVMDIAVLAADSPEILLAWLDREGFRAPIDAHRVFAGYVERGWWWIAVKLAGDSVSDDGEDAATEASRKGGHDAIPRPIAFTYEGPATYPMTISSLSATPYTDIALFVISAGRSTLLGRHGTPMAEADRFVDRRQMQGSQPFLVTELAMPVEAWLDDSPAYSPIGRGARRAVEEPGDRWRTTMCLVPLLEAVGLPVPGRVSVDGNGGAKAIVEAAEEDQTPWISRLRMQLHPQEMTWDLRVVPSPSQEAISRFR